MAGLYFLHLFQITLFIIHCLSKLSIIDHTVLENTIISMTQPGKCLQEWLSAFTPTLPISREYIDDCSQYNPWTSARGVPGLDTVLEKALPLSSFCHKGKELGGQGQVHCDTICFPTSSPCFWCLKCWNSLPRCWQAYIQGLYQQFPRLTFQNVDHISNVIMPRL